MSTTDSEVDHDELPFAAPCRTLAAKAPLHWLKLGWSDMRRAPKQSLTYGLAMLLLSYFISYVAWRFGNFYMLITMLSGFVFVGPAMAIGLYSISCQLQNGQKPVLGYCLREGQRHFGNALLFAVILMVVFLIWARAASMVHVFFPVRSEASWQDYLTFLSIGSAVGAVFAAIIFSAAAFSLPMIMDRKVDMITASVTSINAVLHNKRAMFVWAMLIVLSLLISFLTGLLGLMILLPLIGHATWHGYQETIDASAWPLHD